MEMLYHGITDYLEIMQIAGVPDLQKAVKQRNLPKNAVPKEKEKKIIPVIRVHKENEAEEMSIQKNVPVTEAVPAVSASAGLSHTERLLRLAEEAAKCTKCKELAAFRTQTVFGTGNADAELLFLGEAPGADEDKQGEPFVGRAGQLLTDIIEKGMLLSRADVYICNILRCRPPGNRNPLPEEAERCRYFLEQTLNIIKPKFICCLGAVAAKNLLNSEKTIGELRGKVFDYKDSKVICTYHPAYLLRNPSSKKQTWEDIQLLMRMMK